MKDFLWYAELTDDQLKEVVNRGRVWQPGTKHGKGVWWHATPACFDIETSHLEKVGIAIMYLWQFQLDDLTILGRTWEEWKELVQRIKESFGKTHLAIYVHNISFEFGFVTGMLAWDYIQWRSLEDPIWATSGSIEFRCSHKLTNLKLEAFLKKEKVPHLKTSLDYLKVRFPWTPLTDQELEYGINDVKGLQEALISLMKREGETVASIPKTQTGFVRRPTRNLMKKWQGWLKGAKFGGVSKLGDFNTITMLRQCFEGGCCAVSRWAVGEKVYNVYAYDYKSSYPARILLNRFPMNPFIDAPKEQLTYEWLKTWSGRDYAWMSTLRFDGLRLKDNHNPIPCLRSAHGEGKYRNDSDLFNGRILKAEWFITTINEIDFMSIEEEYEWDSIYVYSAKFCTKKDYLPKELRDFVSELYYIKENSTDPIEKLRAKELLNAIYGMMVTDPLKPVVEWDSEKCTYIRRDATEEDFKKNRQQMFLSYAWGVWVASYARRALVKIIHMVPWKRVLYVDTDSIFIRGDFDFSPVNHAVEKKAKELAFDFKVTPGTLDIDHENVIFKALGTKCYIYQDDRSIRKDKKGRWSDSLIPWAEERGLPTDTTIHTVVSGLNAMQGALELASYKDPFEAFEPGLEFNHVFQTTTVYHHHVWEELGSQEIEIDGHKLWVPNDSVVIKNSPFVLLGEEEEDPLDLLDFIAWEKRKLDHLKEVMK